MAAIETAGLTKRYGEVTAVDDLSFSVREAAVTGFLGPNGAGKTTTLRMILALARPSAGHATVKGLPYTQLEHPARTVGANLEVAGAHPGRKGRDHLRSLAAMASLPLSRADEVLRLVELEAAGGRRAGKYSMGMRQRLGLAATLLGDPEVLILDEPANGLDPQGIRWLRDFLRSMAAEGRTVLVSCTCWPRSPRPSTTSWSSTAARLVDQGPVGAAHRRRPRGRALAAGRTSCRRRSRPPGLAVTADGDELVVDAEDPARVGDVAFEAGRAAARADHARDLARGGVPGADARRRRDPAVIPLVRGEMIKVRTTRTALGFAVAALLLVLAVRADHHPRRRSQTLEDKRDLAQRRRAAAVRAAAALRHRRRDRRVPPSHAGRRPC